MGSRLFPQTVVGKYCQVTVSKYWQLDCSDSLLLVRRRRKIFLRFEHAGKGRVLFSQITEEEGAGFRQKTQHLWNLYIVITEISVLWLWHWANNENLLLSTDILRFNLPFFPPSTQVKFTSLVIATFFVRGSVIENEWTPFSQSE